MDEEVIEEGDDNSLDLYADILEPEDVNNAVEVTSEECEKLKEELQVAVSSNKTLQLQCEILRKNISVLYLTAKNEIQRKKDQLADLQRRYDTLIFRRGKRDVALKQPIETEENNSCLTVSVETGKFTSALAVKKSYEGNEGNPVKGSINEDTDAMKLAAMHGLRKKTVKKAINNEIISVARHQRAEDSPPNPIEGSTDKTCVGKEPDRNLPNNYSKCDTKPSTRRNNDKVREKEGNDSDKNDRKRKTDDNNSHGSSSKRARQSHEKATNRREVTPLRSSAGHGKLERWKGARTSSGSSASSDRRRRSRSRSRDRRRRSYMPNDRLR